MTPLAQRRREALDAFVEGYAPSVLDDAFNFDEQAYAAVELNACRKSGHHITGHRTLRDACDYLSNVDPPWVPVEILSLDDRRRIEIEHHSFISPKDAHAVMLVIPRSVLRALWVYLAGQPAHPSVVRAKRYIDHALN